jgi:hypothetical protein
LSAAISQKSTTPFLEKGNPTEITSGPSMPYCFLKDSARKAFLVNFSLSTPLEMTFMEDSHRNP